jgi:bifunctional UDP-N-acetylglucosamine pyrophosphorylase/glucosamine-1-phosphate N-acetyltransferase
MLRQTPPTPVNQSTPGPGVIVLAAGKGTRMRSERPKVLHEVCGKSMVAHVVDAALAAGAGRIAVVVGHGADDVRAALGKHVEYVEQPGLLGTGDAVQRCAGTFRGESRVVVVNGDAPLVTARTLQPLFDAAPGVDVVLAVNRVADTGAFGRVRRDDAGRVCDIMEADSGEGGIVERNAGIYAFDGRWLWENLPAVGASATGERYLTTLAELAYRQGRRIETVEIDPEDAIGVDDRVRLAEAETIMRRRILERAMLAGVTVRDPASTYVDAAVELEPDVVIEPGSFLRGATRIGSGTVVGPNSTVRDSILGHDCRITQSTVEDSTVGNRVEMGPFCHLRGGAFLEDDCYLGNYAEIKNSRVGRGLKMHHFSYLGDADVGPNVNYAAGAITCNYDGVAKHRTIIGEGAFIGCDTMLVAPVTIGAYAVTAAGAVVNRDVADGERVAGVPARPLPPRREPRS